MTRLFETTSRDLEEYFYVNGIKFTGMYKNESYQTVWQYERTQWLNEVLQMYARYLDHKNRRLS